MRIKFSANLGFLWTDRPLVDGIRAAKSAGFDAVECHFPYQTPAADVAQALKETGLTMLGLNTRRGGDADNGLCALPDRAGEARALIDEAIAYAREINCGCVHAMAGIASGDQAHQTFVENLKYACNRAAEYEVTLLIEPLNRFDAPNYFLRTTQQAMTIISEVNEPNLKLMFDCYHVQRTEGEVVQKLKSLLHHIGHVQCASVPDRGTPDHGDVDYDDVFRAISDIGYRRAIGAEYRPAGDTDASLSWIAKYQSDDG